jgi:hypothetical protein
LSAYWLRDLSTLAGISMQGEQPDFRRHVLLGVWLLLNCKIEIIAVCLIALYLIPNIRRTSGVFFFTPREVRTESPLTRAFLFWGHPLDSCGEAEGRTNLKYKRLLVICQSHPRSSQNFDSSFLGLQYSQ